MRMNLYIATPALLLAANVTLGALGAHGPVHDAVEANGYMHQWQTAVFYGTTQSLGLLALNFLPKAHERLARIVWFLILTGTILFPGALFVLSLTGQRALGMVAPMGGMCMIIGWLLLAYSYCITKQ